MSDFSIANPQSGAGPEVSFHDHDIIELGGAFQEGFSPVAHPRQS